MDVSAVGSTIRPVSASPLEARSIGTSPAGPGPEALVVLDHETGGLLVTGPPGSGKTTLLRERLARLVEGGASPERVALFVLGRRAAREATDHLIRRLGRSMPELPVFTVHAFAFRVVGRRFEELGYPEPPQVLAAPEQYAVVRRMLRAEGAAAWPSHAGLLGIQGFAQQVADFCLRAQERLLGPDEVDALVEASGIPEHREIAGFYRRYLDRLAADGQIDFAGLLLQTVRLLGHDLGPEEAYEHVLVDDYQDASLATEGVLRPLSAAASSLVVAADPGGHVFSYRGTSLEPLARAGEALGCRERVVLPASHRLGDLSLAPLEDPSAPPGEPAGRLQTRLFSHPGEEADAVAHELVRLRVEDDIPWGRMAVILRRYGAYLTDLRHALGRHGVPFVVVAEQAAVATEPANRPVIDLFRYVFRPEARPDLVETLLTSEIGGLDPHALRRLRREARTRGWSLIELVDRGAEDLPPDLGAALDRFRALVRDLPRVAEERGPDGAFFWLWAEAGVPGFAGLVGSGERERDLDALAALGGVLARLVERRPGATIEDYLDTLDAAEFGPDPWVPPEERSPHGVRVISAHRAHGAEFEVVLVAGCLEGEFPSLSHGRPMVDLEDLVRPRTAADRFRERLADERTLFRLAVSRARRRTLLFASRSTNARTPRTPSRFADRLGLRWDGERDPAPPAASLRSMEASLRLRLADPARPAAERLAALALLPAVEARPSEWWWGRDWSDPGRPLYEEQMRTSYSRLSTLQNCGLQYLYSAELGLDLERTHQMWLGSVIHDIIDRVQQGNLERTKEAVLGALREAWRPETFPHRALERQRWRDAQGMLLRWLLETPEEAGDLEATEVAFTFPVEGAVIRGKIDAIFRQESGQLRIRDYKTGRNALTKAEVEEDLQLASYFLAMRRAPELAELGEPEIVELAYLGIPKDEKFKVMSHRPEPGYEERAEATLLELVSRVRAEDFAPSPEADCHFCEFKPICPLWPEGREVLE
jgi:superfamily I DNA/RNA helicase/RecB family exonuclease